jgi:DNA end-binding protein Ku
MQEQGKVAIGRFVMRTKESLVAIRAVDGVLVLETMRYADEVLAPDREGAIPEPATAPTEREMEMARQLVSSLATTFDPTKYHDEYREELLALIDKKASGEEIVAPEAPEEPAKVLDLMAALEASLARTGASSASSRSSASSGSSAKPRATAAKKPAKKSVKKSTSKKSAGKAAPAKRVRKSA